MTRLKALAQLGKDLRTIVGFAMGYVLTALVSVRLDTRLTTRVGSLLARARRKRIDELAAEIAERVGAAGSSVDPSSSAMSHCQMRIENYWARLRGLHSGSTAASYEFAGLEHYEQAVAAGRGVVLWRMRFCSAPLEHAALSRCGMRLVHLSTAVHGASAPTWLGQRVISPLYARAETWHLAERVVIPVDGSLGYMRVLMKRLEQNRTLSIFGDGAGRKTVRTPFLDGVEEFATGAPGLAHRSGAALLTVRSDRTGPYTYRLAIDPPIEVSRDLARREYILRAAEEYASRLETCIRERPADWTGWQTSVL